MGVVVVQLRRSSTRWCFMLFLVYLVTNGFLVVDAQKMHPSEVEALHAIRSHLVDPFKNLKSWSSGDPCQANWTGVLCSPLKDDGYLHVQALQLLNMNLSGTLAPEVGQLSYMEIFDIMWNRIAGTIPKEIGNVKSLQLLLVNGNLLTGPLPDEIGFLPYLDRLQIDENYITGPIPKSFGNLNNTKHLHMNNNSLSGQIPAEIARMPSLVHLLLDNNNLSGYLPSELASSPVLRILQLDNNQFTGRIPYSYSNMTTLLKMSLRNCSLQGTVPDLSGIVQLSYIDLSWNHLTGPIPINKLSTNITTIDLSHNNLNGTVPLNFSGLPHLQKLSFANNRLSGSISTSIWQLSGLSDQLIVDFQNNSLSNVSDVVNLPANVILRLQGNPLCSNTGLVNLSQICGFLNDSGTFATNPPATTQCLSQSCPYGYEYVPSAPVQCFCAAPIKVGFRLKSPSISIFPPYVPQFEIYLTSGLSMDIYQLYIDSYDWEEGPRLRMYLKFFPSYSNDSHSSTFNTSDVRRIKYMFTGWKIPDSPLFGPKELLNFTLEGPYSNLMISSAGSTWGTGLIVAIVVGVIAVVLITFSAILLLAMRRHLKHYHALSRKRQSSTIPIKIDDVKVFSYDELASATDNFCTSAQVGRGGYGTVYKGTLSDGSTVAIKRAEAGSLQGEREFFTEIELLSRLHHRNLVSLVGYCNEEAEQMLVYEFIENGTLRDHLSAKKKNLLSFPVRLRIALGAARGIQYLHHEVDPPVFHRDIKASNILLDSRFIAKVADFGLSKLAPVPDIEGNRPGHVSTVVRGTPGYLDPEYFLTNKLTDKSDVYSLGVVFLELLTGLLPISHGKNLVREVRDACREGALLNIMDPEMDSYPIECAEPFVKLAIRCCEDEPEKRPPITEIVRELESIFVMIPETVVTPTISGALSETTMSSTVQTPLFSGPIVTRSAELSSDISETRSFNVVIHHSSPR